MQAMNTKIHILIGLPGSGKTHLLNSLNVKFVDNVYDKYPWNFEQTIELIRGKEECAVSDVIFCETDNLEKFKGLVRNWEVHQYFFKNHPMECKFNVIRRNGKKYLEQLALIDRLSRNYVIPELGKNDKIIPVYKDYENKKPN